MRIRTPVICAIAIGLLAGSSGAVTAQESDVTSNEVSAGIESPGPLGRPYADWARDYFVWRAEKPKANGCRVVEDGAVVFVAPAWDAAKPTAKKAPVMKLNVRCNFITNLLVETIGSQIPGLRFAHRHPLPREPNPRQGPQNQRQCQWRFSPP